MSGKKLPNFLIVGAAKAGTTSLYRYLKQHPNIFMPEFKEPQFFVKEEIKNRLNKKVTEWNDYVNLFTESKDKIAVGEASVFYLYYYKTCIQNILHFLGSEVKIIMILRNPITRAFSAYNHTLKNNPQENCSSFEEALKAEELRLEKDNLSPMLHYKRMGLYSEAVNAFKKNFENVLILDYKTLVDAPQAMMNEIFTFLEVKPIDLDFSQVYNKGGTVWKSSLLKNVSKSKFGKQIIKLLPPVVYTAIKKDLYTPIKETVSDNTYFSLMNYYKDDIKKLIEIDSKFAYWLNF